MIKIITAESKNTSNTSLPFSPKCPPFLFLLQDTFDSFTYYPYLMLNYTSPLQVSPRSIILSRLYLSLSPFTIITYWFLYNDTRRKTKKIQDFSLSLSLARFEKKKTSSRFYKTNSVRYRRRALVYFDDWASLILFFSSSSQLFLS